MKKSLRFHTMPNLEENSIFLQEMKFSHQSCDPSIKILFQRLQQLTKSQSTPNNKQYNNIFSTEKKIKLSNLQRAKEMQDRASNRLAEIELLKTKKRHKKKQIYSLDLHNNLDQIYSKRRYTSIYQQFINASQNDSKNVQMKQPQSFMSQSTLPDGIKKEEILEKHPKLINFIQQKMQEKSKLKINQRPIQNIISNLFQKKQLSRKKTMQRQRQIQLLKSTRVDRKKEISNSLVLTYLNKIFHIQKNMTKPEVRKQLQRYSSFGRYALNGSATVPKQGCKRKELFTPIFKRQINTN